MKVLLTIVLAFTPTLLAQPLSQTKHGVNKTQNSDCETDCGDSWNLCNSWCYGEDAFSCGGSCDRELRTCLAVRGSFMVQ
jgi:hypothetical protein